MRTGHAKGRFDGVGRDAAALVSQPVEVGARQMDESERADVPACDQRRPVARRPGILPGDEHASADPREMAQADGAQFLRRPDLRKQSAVARVEAYERRIEYAKSRGNHAAVVNLRFTIARMLADTGRLAEARTMLEELSRVSDSDRAALDYAGGPDRVPLALIHVFTRQGQFADARRVVGTLFTTIGDRAKYWGHLQSRRLARIAFYEGDLAAARAQALRAIEPYRQSTQMMDEEIDSSPSRFSANFSPSLSLSQGLRNTSLMVIGWEHSKVRREFGWSRRFSPTPGR